MHYRLNYLLGNGRYDHGFYIRDPDIAPLQYRDPAMPKSQS